MKNRSEVIAAILGVIAGVVLLSVLGAGTVDPNGHFQGLTLGGHTNVVSDDNLDLTYNGAHYQRSVPILNNLTNGIGTNLTSLLPSAVQAGQTNDGTANWSASGTTNSTLPGVASADGGAFTNSLVLPSNQAIKYLNFQGALTHAGTVTLDFTPRTNTINGLAYSYWPVDTLSLTGDLTLATANLATNRCYLLRVLNAQSTNCAFTLPSWVSLGAAAPVSIVAGKTALFSLQAWGSTDANVDMIYVAEP